MIIDVVWLLSMLLSENVLKKKVDTGMQHHRWNRLLIIYWLLIDYLKSWKKCLIILEYEILKKGSSQNEIKLINLKGKKLIWRIIMSQHIWIKSSF